MKHFHIKVFQQSRILPGIIFFPASCLVALYMGANTQSFVFGGAVALSSLLLWYYFAVGHLKVTLAENGLEFLWDKKLLFNYRPIKPISIADITAIVIQGDFLRKIVISERVQPLATMKFSGSDSLLLVRELRRIAVENKIEVLDDWSAFAKKRSNVVFYRVMTVIKVALLLVALILLALKYS